MDQEIVDRVVHRLCSDEAIANIEAVPELVKENSLEDLQSEGVEIKLMHKRCVAGLEAEMAKPEHLRDDKLFTELLKGEYISRKLCRIYADEFKRRRLRHWVN